MHEGINPKIWYEMEANHESQDRLYRQAVQ